jgi:hypothetical protein
VERVQLPLRQDNQFMIHFLNDLTTGYDLQLALMEKRVGDLEKSLNIEEIKAESSLCFID